MVNFKHFKTFNKFIAIILILLSIIMLTACKSSKKSPLIGKWELTEDVTVFGFTIHRKGSIAQFYEDGNADMMSFGFKYEDLGDKIKFINGSDVSYIEYKLEGDTLILYDGGTGAAADVTYELVFKRIE